MKIYKQTNRAIKVPSYIRRARTVKKSEGFLTFGNIFVMAFVVGFIHFVVEPQIPLPTAEAAGYAQEVIVNHQTISLDSFCKQARKDHESIGRAMTGDLLEICGK
jgi:hypothetical protein